MGSTPVGIYSASGISSILGMNPYTTRLHAWQNVMEKLKPGFNQSKGYALPEFPDNAAIRFGHAFENAIIKLAEESEKLPIVLREELYIKEIGDISISCHIDGMFSTGTDRIKILHEGKTTWSRAFYSVKGEDCETEDGTITEYKRRWGSPGTDEIPVEYQIQTAVQRICTGAELVKLSVLIFPKNTQEFEKEGWEIEKVAPEHRTAYQSEYMMKKDDGFQLPICWARTFQEIGNFHNYNLPTNKKLESLIIEKVQEFDEKYVKTELPPEFENYADVRRMVTQPMGTVIATPEMITKAAEYSELVRILGAKSPHKKRQEALKVEILGWMNEQRKDDWSVPSDKMCLISPDGGDKLISFSKSGFRGKRA